MRKWRTIEMQRLTPEEFRSAPRLPLTVVLDDIRSAHNVGSIFRTGDAFRIERLLLCGITAQPPSTEMHKTALGAELVVDWQYHRDAREAVQRLHNEGYIVLCAEQADGSTMLHHMTIDPSQRYAVVLGNEVHGVQQSVIDISDGCIEIPQRGTKHSMNVSVAAGVVMWEIARQMLKNRN